MNQILATQNVNSKTTGKKTKEPLGISKVTKISSIVLLIFGIFIIGSASYAIYKENENKINTPTKPTIVQERKDDTTLLMKITHDKTIQSIEYNWNDDSKEIISGTGRKYIEQEIKIPGGTNTLHVTATDIDGEKTSYEQTFETENIIQLEVIGSKMKVTAELQKDITYMTYRWNEGQETKIDINSKTVEQEIGIPKGLNKLTVVLVDTNNETIEKVQEVKGVTRPTLDVSVDDTMENLIIKMSDEIALQRLEITVNNGRTYKGSTSEKYLEYKFPVSNLDNGDNILKVVVYNSENITEELTINCKK